MKEHGIFREFSHLQYIHIILYYTYTLVYTVTRASHLKVDSSGFFFFCWGFAVQIAKMHLHTFDTGELWGWLGLFQQFNRTQWLLLKFLHTDVTFRPLWNNKPNSHLSRHLSYVWFWDALIKLHLPVVYILQSVHFWGVLTFTSARDLVLGFICNTRNIS